MLRGSSAARFLVLVALLAILAVTAVLLGPPSPAAVAGLVAGLGLLGPVVVVVVSAFLLIAFVPRTVMAAVAGLAFGPVVGAGYILAGAVLGALAAFGVGRWLGREYAASRAAVARLDGWLIARGTWGVAVLRLLPLAPFGLVSYAFGTTGVRFRAYLLGTVLAAAPSTVIYASLGAAALRPGGAAFFWSLASAAALGVGGVVMIAAVRRRQAAAGGQLT